MDGIALEMPENTSIGLSVGIASITDPVSARVSYSQTISVPRTPHNSKVFRHTEQILSPEIFNHTEHTAAVYEDGVELIKGKAYYEGATDSEYKMQIVGNEFDWLERIRDKKLNEIDSDKVSEFKKYANMTDAQRKAIFFGLLDHGCWWQEIGEEKIRRQWATYADLVPFVGLHTILQSIFKGYTINADTISNLLTRLYVTGAWKAPENADVLAEDNEWEVSCTGRNIREVTANGNTEVVVGTKVTADNHGNEAAYCDVFDNVESDPHNRIEVESNEVSVGEDVANHNVLSFAPSEDCNTAYKMRLQYTTQMAVQDYTPIFADTIHFGGMPVAQLGLEDSNALAGGMLNSEGFSSYKSNEITLLQSGRIPDSEMRNFYLKLSNPELYSKVVQVAVSVIGKSQYYWYNSQTISEDVKSEMFIRGAVNFDYSDKVFDILANGHPDTGVRAAIGLVTHDGEVLIIGGDESAILMWKPILKGYQPNQKVRIMTNPTYKKNYRDAKVQLWQVGEDDTISFDVQLLTPAFRVSTLEPSSLAVGFTSSNATMLGSKELIVGVGEATLSPVFNSVLPYGYRVSLNDVGGEANATDMLKAIMHLFNLRVYCNPDTKQVHLLPYSDFYNNVVVDWRKRVDLDKGVEITTIGDDIGNALKLTYQEATPAAQHYNARHTEPYLSYRTPLLSKRSNKEYELQNAVFSAPMTIPTRDIFPHSPLGGYLLNIVAENTQKTLYDFNNEIPQILVQVPAPTEDPTETIQYVGAKGLLADYEQPDFVVVDRNEQTSISFADTKGVQGLHKYYDKQVEAWNYGKRIVCYCRVLPQEIDSLRKAGTSPVDFRSRFLLNIGGEDIYCRLESIENYEPQNTTHKCTFVY